MSSLEIIIKDVPQATKQHPLSMGGELVSVGLKVKDDSGESFGDFVLFPKAGLDQLATALEDYKSKQTAS